MTRIPYHRIPPADAYQRVQTSAPPRPEDPAAPAAPPKTHSATAPGPALSADEAAMIDRSFPSESKAALRLYGREGAHTVRPDALGGRLDLSA